ncbi:MAG: pantetheine-phosphate adenylyltransferase [Candidatus Heimdallarchaeaceae archaeon]
MPWVEEVIMGGTFDHLHHGHRALLEAAKSFGSFVRVGLTTDEFAKSLRRSDPNLELMQPFDVRKKNLEDYLSSRNFENFEIVKIDDRYGFALTAIDAEGIVVTEETYPTAVDINKLRTMGNLDQLLILVIPFVYDETGVIISSRRIRQQLAE